jgi:hypothetical protein
VRVRDGETDVATVTLGTGTLIAKGRGWRAAPGTVAAGTALSLRRRNDLVLRLTSPTLTHPTTRRGLQVVIELGPRILSGISR